MSIDHFDLERFKAALPRQAVYVGMDKGEETFSIPLGKAKLLIRSSIGSAGVADATGDNSIRLILVNIQTDRSIGGKADTYTQRTSGWESRLKEKIEYMISLRQQALDCPECGQPLGIWTVQKPGANNGRLFASCSDRSHKSFKWISDTLPPKPLDSFIWPGDSKPQPSLIKDIRDVPLPDIQSEKPVASTGTWGKIAQSENKTPAVVAPTYKYADHVDLSGLNPQQLEVVHKAWRGPSVIDSVPGSGKTTSVKYMVAHMILEEKIDPSRIGLFTFTNNASETMRERIAKLVWPDINDDDLDFLKKPRSKDEDPLQENGHDRAWIESDPVRLMLVDWCCTIHALSLRLLRKYYSKTKKFIVLQGSPFQWKADQLVKDSMAELQLDDDLKSVKHYIAVAIHNQIPPISVQAERFFTEMIESFGSENTHLARPVAEIYCRYMQFLRSNNCLDFDMMEADCAKLLKSDYGFRIMAQTLFDYIIVDEAQDTNSSQSEILWTMASLKKNITYVGDADQMLYAWRGAVPDVMRSIFDAHWKETGRYLLPINYRSTRTIIGLSSKLILKNYAENDKYLKLFTWADNNPDGTEVHFEITKTFDELESKVISYIHDYGANPGDWYILSRTRAECASIHTALITAGIPAINKSGGLLFGAPHIRKVLAYARLACNYHNARDDMEIVKEIANVATKDFMSPLTSRRHLDSCTNTKPWVDCGCPVVRREGIDHCHVRYWSNASVEEARSWDGIYMQMFDHTKTGQPSMRSKGATDLVRFVERIEKQTDAVTCLNTIINDCVLQWLSVEKGIDLNDPIEGSESEDFALLINMAKPGQTVEQYLDEIEALSSTSGAGADDDKSVIVGTVHWAKGAERNKVIMNITRLPIIPPANKPDKLPTSKPPSIEEERCVLYVGLTRAKDDLFVIQSKEWLEHEVAPSIFIEEMGFEIDRQKEDESEGFDITNESLRLFTNKYPENGFSVVFYQMAEDADSEGVQITEEEFLEEFDTQRYSKGGYSGKDIAEVEAFFGMEG